MNIGNAMIRRQVVLISLALASMGCATTAPPDTEMNAARQAVQSAEVSGAQVYAQAAYLQANEKLTGAELALNQQNYELAKQLAMQAEVDARVAAAKATNQTLRAKIQRINDSIELLRSELQKQS